MYAQDLAIGATRGRQYAAKEAVAAVRERMGDSTRDLPDDDDFIEKLYELRRCLADRGCWPDPGFDREAKVVDVVMNMLGREKGELHDLSPDLPKDPGEAFSALEQALGNIEESVDRWDRESLYGPPTDR